MVVARLLEPPQPFSRAPRETTHLAVLGSRPSATDPGSDRPNPAPTTSQQAGAGIRRPVVLAPCPLANQTVNFRTISPFLKNRGFCVFSLTYGTKDDVKTPFYQPGGLRKMQSSARELKRFVKRVKVRHRRPQGRHRRPFGGQPDAGLVRAIPPRRPLGRRLRRDHAALGRDRRGRARDREHDRDHARPHPRPQADDRPRVQLLPPVPAGLAVHAEAPHPRDHRPARRLHEHRHQERRAA